MRLTFKVAMALMCLVALAASDYPPTDSKEDVLRLSSSTRSVYPRGLADEDILSLNRLPDLRLLDFSAGRAVKPAKVTDEGLARLASLKFTQLETLNLGYCTNITDAGLIHVAKMDSIKWLSLEVCPRITDAGLPSLLTMTNLMGLDLRGCTEITDKGLECLATKTNWQTIWLAGCPKVTGEAVTKLQRALPNIKVEKDEREWSFHK